MQTGKIGCAMLFITAVLRAQTSAAPMVTKYKVFDVGTLGGNFSSFYNTDNTFDEFTPHPLNDSGQLAGASLISGVTAGSYIWSHGVLKQLPTLPNGNLDGGGSNAFGINNSGLCIGASSYGLVDPNNGNVYFEAVSWPFGQVHSLGDLGGHGSWANYVNDSGVVAGYAYNTTPDPYSAYENQYHAVTWTNGVIRDLGTLGGSDSEAWVIDARGNVIGNSYTNTIPIPPFNQPQFDAFEWSNGNLIDLGNLGGVFSTPTSINAAGQIAVVSYDATNSFYQTFIWHKGNRTILQPIAGNFNEALTINDLGISTGAASDATDSNLIAAAWGPAGNVKALGTVSGDTGSLAFGINRHNVIVGGSGEVPPTALGLYAHAFVWQNGSLHDLNTLVSAGSPLVLNVAYAINDAGVIAGMGTTSTGDMHAFVLVPESTSSETFETAASHPAIKDSAIQRPANNLLRRALPFKNR